MDFGLRWRAWIAECLYSASFSILLNCSPIGFYSTSRGPIERDPLPPFFFIIVVEALSQLMNNAVNANLIKGFDLCNGNISISNLLFVDDALLFCNTEEDQLHNVKAILLCFEVVSGLRVSFFKSKIISIKVNEDCQAG